jgi:hypothetical protein
MWVSLVAVPARVSVVPSPQFTVIEVTVPSESAALKVTVTIWPVSAGFGLRLVMVTVGGASNVTLKVPVLPECVESPLYVPVTVTDPAVVEVKVTEQLPLTSVHGLPVNVPVGAVKATVPVGVVAVPGDVSVTVAVHVVDEPVLMRDGEQVTAVLVVRGFTTTLVVPVLAE